MKRTILLLLCVVLPAALLTGCGGTEPETQTQAQTDMEAVPPTAEPGASGMTFRQAEAEAAAKHTVNQTPDPNALQEYVAEGVGTFYLPADFEMVCQQTEDPLPMRSVTFAKGNVTVTASQFGPEAFQAAGVSIPADLESFSAWDQIRKDVPEDAVFTQDELGNLYVDWIDSDGLTVYYVLKAGSQSYGAVVGYAPAGDEAVGLIPLWLSKATLD